MKREQGKSRAARTRGGDGLTIQSNQGFADDEVANIDLKGALVGEYRLQGELIRAFYVNERTWFVAVEVCAVLGIANPRDAIRSLRTSSRGVGNTDTGGGERLVNLITESGLYFLIFKSRKPQAEAFQAWVTDEVLPQIRRTGSYSANQAIGGGGSIVLPDPGRYVVVAAPGQAPHVRRTSISEIVTEFDALDRQIMCYTLKQIEVWWDKVQTRELPESIRTKSFAFYKLDDTIRTASEMADHFLRVQPQNGSEQ